MDSKSFTKQDLENIIGKEVKKLLYPIDTGENTTTTHNYHRENVRPPRNNYDNYPRQRNYNTPKPVSSNYSNDKRYNYRERSNNLIKIKLMVTYVESATRFYGQHLSPELMENSQELDGGLARLCPSLPPTSNISKHGLYATTWSNLWYRCITCGPASQDDTVEIYFVDYGNKERRKICDLVQITNTTISRIPYLATCYRLAGLRDCVEEELKAQAIGEFNTTSVLEGVVASLPTYDTPTDIILIRGEASDHKPLTYNSLMLEKKYAMKIGDDEDFYTKPLPCYYRFKLFSQKLQHMNDKLREKDMEISELKTKLALSDKHGADQMPENLGSSFAWTSDTLQASPRPEIPEKLSSFPADTPEKLNILPPQSTPEKLQPSPPDDPGGKSANNATSFTDKQDVLEEVSSYSDVSYPVVDDVEGPPHHRLGGKAEKNVLDGPRYFREIFERLYEEVESYTKHKKYCDTSTEELLKQFEAVKESYSEANKEFEIESELAGKKRIVMTANDDLKKLTNAIKILNSTKGLEEAVQRRDEAMVSVVTRIDEFITTLDNSDIKFLCEKLKKSIEESEVSTDEDTNTKTPESVDELFQNVLHQLQTSRQTQDKEHEKCNESLVRLSGTFIKLSRDLTGGEESTNISSSDPSDILSNLTATTDLLHDYNTLNLDPKSTLEPLVTQLKSLVLAKNKSMHVQLRSYINTAAKYQKDKDHLNHVINNKPDLSTVKNLRVEIKKKRRELRMAVAACEFDDSSEIDSDDENMSGLREKMLELHGLLQKEETEQEKLCRMARDNRPELLIECPQLKYSMAAKGPPLLKTTWDINDFILPNSETFVNELQQNVRQSFYGDSTPIFCVEYPIHCATSSFEETALAAIEHKLNGCFAIILDKKGLRAYGLTKTM